MLLFKFRCLSLSICFAAEQVFSVAQSEEGKFAVCRNGFFGSVGTTSLLSARLMPLLSVPNVIETVIQTREKA
jgi:hypothetical protein